jgi:hypothetical protein
MRARLQCSSASVLSCFRPHPRHRPHGPHHRFPIPSPSLLYLQSCPTIFGAPPSLGASFNTSLMSLIGVAISDEVRAMNNVGGERTYDNRPVDLNLWLPSINLNVNPVWGRNIEVYGEDPLHAGLMAASLIKVGHFCQWGPWKGGSCARAFVGMCVWVGVYRVQACVHVRVWCAHVCVWCAHVCACVYMVCARACMVCACMCMCMHGVCMCGHVHVCVCMCVW